MRGESMVTYQSEDGQPIFGEFDFVTGTEWFDDWDEPERLIRKRWVCVEAEAGTFYSTHAGLLCSVCEDEPGDPPCEHCHGTGEDPMRGAGWVADTQAGGPAVRAC